MRPNHNQNNVSINIHKQREFRTKRNSKTVYPCVTAAVQYHMSADESHRCSLHPLAIYPTLAVPASHLASALPGNTRVCEKFDLKKID